jgi:hypothetical protein
MRFVRYFVAPFFLCLATAAHAEVSDKVASPQYVWGVSAIVAFMALVGCRRWPRASFVVVPLLALAGWYLSHGDPEVVAAYCLEVGTSAAAIYMLHLLAAGILMPAAALVGGVWGCLRRRGHAT